MLKHRLVIAASLLNLVFLSGATYAGTTNPWVGTDTVSNEIALETRLGLWGETVLLNAMLWNNGSENVLDMMSLHASPTGVTIDQVESGVDSGEVFALGDWCFSSDDAVMPYIKDFNINLLRYNPTAGTTVSMEIPASTADQYTSTDCFSLHGSSELVIAANNFDQKRLDYFRSIDGGLSWDLRLSYNFPGDTIIDAFAGGFRDTHDAIDDQFIGSTFQLGSGSLYSGALDPLDWSGDPQVLGMTSMGDHSLFVGNGHIKETRGGYFNQRAVGVANGGTAIAAGMIDLNDGDFNFTLTNNVEAGAVLPFQGVSVSPVENMGMMECHFFSNRHARIQCDTFDSFGSGAAPEIIPNYPFEDNGGPVDSVYSGVIGQAYIIGIYTTGGGRGIGGPVTAIATFDPALLGGNGGGGPLAVPVFDHRMLVVFALLLLLVGGLVLRSGNLRW